MHLYTELNEIPLPDFALSDGYRVYIQYPIGNGLTKKLYIGQFANKAERTFYANENFRLYCPKEWAEAYEKENAPHYQYNIGMYAVTLAVSHRTNLYPVIHKTFGPLYGNAILDFAMYSIMERSNVAYRFKPAMEHQFIFSRDRKNDDWLSHLFNSLITVDMIQQFRIDWIQECKKRGLKKVWISIDGSNNDCECTASELACKGDTKSGNNKTCVSYMYAVNAEDGSLVTFFTYYGDCVDSKAFLEMCEFLKSNDLDISGVILDRGFLTHSALEQIINNEFQFVVMLKSDTYAHTQMIIDHGSEIYWNVEHLVGTNGLFGLTDGPRVIFKDYGESAYINLYFDAKNGSERKITFANKLYDAIQEAQSMIEKGIVPSIKAGMTQYLEIKKMQQELPQQQPPTTADPAPDAITYKIVPTDLCNKVLYKKGFQSIASSTDFGAKETNRIYHLRDVSEKQYMICKSMEGGDVFRIHSTEGIQSKGLVCFVASIIRREIGITCEKLGLRPSIMLPQIERPALALMANGTYKYIHTMKGDLEKLFVEFGYGKEDLEVIAGDVNERETAHGKGVSQYHRTPEEIRQAHIKLRRSRNRNNSLQEDEYTPVEGDEEIKPVKKLGRPLGSKNKKTLEREAEQSFQDSNKKQNSKRGRPPGSKNKKTLELEAAGLLPKPKRNRGRPVGSKDKYKRTRRTKEQLLKSEQ